MNRNEFIGKLQMVYVGDRNAFNEIVEDNQKLKNELVYSKVEIDRLNNIIKELSKDVDMWNKKYNEQFNIINELEEYIIEEIDDAQEELNIILQGNNLDYKNECTKEFNCIKNALDMLLDKLKELKENK